MFVWAEVLPGMQMGISAPAFLTQRKNRVIMPKKKRKTFFI